MSLNHAQMWNEKVGFQFVTKKEAAKRFPYGASADSGFFRCGLCFEPVRFTRYTGINIQHFRHGVKNKDTRDCEDRQNAAASALKSNVDIWRIVHGRVLPLRLRMLDARSFRFELGFYYPPYGFNDCKQIIVESDEGNLERFRPKKTYNVDRIAKEGTTYLDVGDVPHSEYKFRFIASDRNAQSSAPSTWPNFAAGVDMQKGVAIFNVSDDANVSGRAIPKNGFAYSGSEYYLLSRGLAPRWVRGLEALTSAVKTNEWNLYRIAVREFTQEAALFFLKYGVYLRPQKARFFPIWPPCVSNKNIVNHFNRELYYFCRSKSYDVKLRVNSANGGGICEQYGGKLFSINTNGRDQLLALGQADASNSGALGVAFLFEHKDADGFFPKLDKPEIAVYEKFSGENVLEPLDGKPLSQTPYREPPKTRRLYVKGSFVGKVVVLRDGKIREITRLPAGKAIPVESVNFGTEIRVYQGCDLVRVVRFECETTVSTFDVAAADRELAARLAACRGATIPAPRSFGTFAAAFPQYKTTLNWIRERVRKGDMPRTAYLLLLNVLQNKRQEGVLR